MTKTVLGISAFYHDSAAALVQNGKIIAAAQEERFSRKKHDPCFPTHAINYCLEEAFIEAEEIDAIVFYDNPLLTWDRVLKNCLTSGSKSLEQFIKASNSLLGVKMWVKEYVKNFLGSLGKKQKLLFTEHHMAHAASAFYPSPFEKAAIITLDGVGEWTTTAIGFGQDSTVELLEEIHYPHSLGLLYSSFTYFCGFKVNSGEYKLMGLAPYGKPVYYKSICENLIDIREDGSFRLNTEYFGYLDSFTMTNNHFEQLFSGPPRQSESRITQREMDLAASIQKVTEEIVCKMASYAKKLTKLPNLVLAGGVALNCVANGKIMANKTYENIWIQPAAGDAGGALGAALLTYYTYFGIPRKVTSKKDSQQGSLLGPSFSTREIMAFLDRWEYPYEQMEATEERAETIAKAIAAGKIVGHFAGRMEFGPRALGARSILGDPRDPRTQTTMNLKIKFRESFRPFAPAVLEECCQEYFEMDLQSPYMLLVAPVCENKRLPMKTDANQDLLKIITQPRSDIPAVTHVDYSARVQTVAKDETLVYYLIIKKFRELTGCGVIVNTSFNVRGEPIVCTPKQAYLCFMRTNIDLLVLENCLLWKEKQPAFKDNENWKETYELD